MNNTLQGSLSVKHILRKLKSREKISEAEAHSAMQDILVSAARPEQIGALFAFLEVQTPDRDILLGLAKAILSKARLMNVAPVHAMDVCGTGGDGFGTFNISTATAFVVAAGGQPVLKHGNRAASSQCGSFDVLEELRIPFCENEKSAKEALSQYGLGFLFAPMFHSSLGILTPLRKNLGFRTVMNALGPILSPAQVPLQLIGVAEEALLTPLAETLQALGTKRSLLFHSMDGADELKTDCPAKMILVTPAKLTTMEFNSDSHSLPQSGNHHLQGGTRQINAQILSEVLSGAPGPRRDVVALNAGAAFFVSEHADSINEGVAMAQNLLERKRAMHLFQSLQRPLPTEEVVSL